MCILLLAGYGLVQQVLLQPVKVYLALCAVKMTYPDFQQNPANAHSNHCPRLEGKNMIACHRQYSTWSLKDVCPQSVMHTWESKCTGCSGTGLAKSRGRRGSHASLVSCIMCHGAGTPRLLCG